MWVIHFARPRELRDCPLDGPRFALGKGFALLFSRALVCLHSRAHHGGSSSSPSSPSAFNRGSSEGILVATGGRPSARAYEEAPLIRSGPILSTGPEFARLFDRLVGLCESECVLETNPSRSGSCESRQLALAVKHRHLLHCAMLQPAALLASTRLCMHPTRLERAGRARAHAHWRTQADCKLRTATAITFLLKVRRHTHSRLVFALLLVRSRSRQLSSETKPETTTANNNSSITPPKLVILFRYCFNHIM